MNKKVVIAGGTGFIGQYLAARLGSMGWKVILISRGKGHVSWNNRSAIVNALEHSDILINLAGKSVDCRYNEKNKSEIFRSRTGTTKALGEAVLQCQHPPALWINSSTATIYRHAEDRAMTESAGEIGRGFSIEVAKRWEQSFFDFQLTGTRQVALRMAVVLGESGGVIRPFVNLVRFGLGGRQGNGRQMFSWIHIEDVLQIILFIRSHPDMNGVYNCSSSHPISNNIFMRSIRQIMGVQMALPSPVWLLKIGARIIRTETELILKSRWVIPEKLLAAGYVFHYPTVDMALKNILSQYNLK